MNGLIRLCDEWKGRKNAFRDQDQKFAVVWEGCLFVDADLLLALRMSERGALVDEYKRALRRLGWWIEKLKTFHLEGRVDVKILFLFTPLLSPFLVMIIDCICRQAKSINLRGEE